MPPASEPEPATGSAAGAEVRFDLAAVRWWCWWWLEVAELSGSGGSECRGTVCRRTDGVGWAAAAAAAAVSSGSISDQ